MASETFELRSATLQGKAVTHALFPGTSVLLAHIFAGTLGLFSGAAAIVFLKGSPRHMLEGKIFVVSMLIMAVGAVHAAIERNQPGNIGCGILTFYLILTAWLTARRPTSKNGPF